MMNNTGKHIIEHFSHEHPLIFNDESNLDSDDIKPKFCSICGLIFFINSYYSCSRIEQGCHFLMHQQCANRLPKELRVAQWFKLPWGGYDFKFSLGGPKNPVIANEKCIKCGQICKNYTYSNRIKGHIHPWCGEPLEILTKHRSHDHPLSPTRREISCVCNSCGEEERGIFLSCQACDYWISHDCALLPTVAIHDSHSHPLLLFYSILDIERPLIYYDVYTCDICRGPIDYKSFYSCRSCDYDVHLKCIKSSMKNITPEERRKYIVHLPIAKEDIVFSSLIANLEEDEEVDATSTSITMSKTEEFHEHQLIFHGTSVVDEVVDDLQQRNSTSINRGIPLCNACINPINSSTPYYRCSVAQCHFLVHEFCAKLPSRIKGSYFVTSTWFLFKKRKEFFSVFRCHFCGYECNGFGYSAESESSSKGICVDVECAFAPRIIKHESHKNHYLLLERHMGWLSSIQTKCCFTTHLSFCFYRCTSCPGFLIHQRCALLPREVRHKFDKHPLRLITDGGNLTGRSMESDREYLENCGFCEVCEKPMDPRIWFYYCSECDHYFHVNCIPSVGRLSKFKFGGTLDHVGCHDHPVTSVRMLTIGSQSCTYCTKEVRGFEDDWAFHCQPCDVWIHNYCARKISGSLNRRIGTRITRLEVNSSEKNNSESDVDSS